MSMRDQIVEILCDELYENRQCVEGHEHAADAILDALPDMIAPLVWHGGMAIGLSGVYTLAEYKNLCFSWGFNEDDLWTHGTEADSLDEAKAAANTHLRAAIMAAFTGETR